MIKIPEHFKVLGLDFEVRYDENIARESRVHGSTHLSKQIIFLDPANTIQHQQEVFLHELIHAIWWKMGLPHLKDMDTKWEEAIVDHLASGFFAVLCDNPNLLNNA